MLSPEMNTLPPPKARTHIHTLQVLNRRCVNIATVKNKQQKSTFLIFLWKIKLTLAVLFDCLFTCLLALYFCAICITSNFNTICFLSSLLLFCSFVIVLWTFWCRVMAGDRLKLD